MIDYKNILLNNNIPSNVIDLIDLTSARTADNVLIFDLKSRIKTDANEADIKAGCENSPLQVIIKLGTCIGFLFDTKELLINNSK